MTHVLAFLAGFVAGVFLMWRFSAGVIRDRVRIASAEAFRLCGRDDLAERFPRV